MPQTADKIYVDESGISGSMTRLYGRSPRGQRCFVPKSGKRYRRLNVIAGIRNGQIIGQCIRDWNTNSGWFCFWFEFCLIPILRVGSAIIMDNASFHPKKRLEEIARKYCMEILWLPPYSPNKNPIEHFWAQMKNWLRIYSTVWDNMLDAIKFYF